MSKYWTIEELSKITREDFDKRSQEEQKEILTQSRKLKAEQELQSQQALDQMIQNRIAKKKEFEALGEKNLKGQ